jgi:arylsulfatase A-like enzyme
MPATTPTWSASGISAKARPDTGARGFERDFSLLDGAGSYWDMTNFTGASPLSVFTEDGRYLTKLPDDYYATKTYTDKLIGFIDANRGDGKPFFAYVAHQAPHDPYHLPQGLAQSPRRRVRQGLGRGAPGAPEAAGRDWASCPRARSLAERMWFVPDPIVLAPASRALLGKKMELYAGMVENMDHHIGRLIDHLKEIGEYENTVFIVFGDNGAEGTDLFAHDRGKTRARATSSTRRSRGRRPIPTPGAIPAPTSVTARCGRRCR